MTAKNQVKTNNEILKEIVLKSGLTQQAILDAFNKNQSRPLSIRTLKAYLAKDESATKLAVPDLALEHFIKVLKK